MQLALCCWQTISHIASRHRQGKARIRHLYRDNAGPSMNSRVSSVRPQTRWTTKYAQPPYALPSFAKPCEIDGQENKF